MNEREAWIALASTEGVGPVTFERLLAAHGSAGAALEAVASLPEGRADRELRAMAQTRFRTGLARRLRAASGDPGATQRAMAMLGGWITTPLDHDYPRALHGIEDPPLVLYGLGDPASLHAAALVAVVGTRRATATGRDLAARVARRLVEAGVVVVSGLAMGIDGVVHQATLEGGGRTVGVVGSGLDDPGPSVHRRLARRMASQGAVVSELAPGVRATRGTFPRRNRIISGLSRATVVIEAPARSGALITARHALEQGRDLLVAPGRPLDLRVAGCLALLRETPAQPLVGLDEMLADLGLGETDEASAQGGSELSALAALELLGPTQRLVADALARGPQTVDGLCRLTGLEAGVVAASLTMLQLRGWARVHGVTQLATGPLLALDAPAR